MIQLDLFCIKFLFCNLNFIFVFFLKEVLRDEKKIGGILLEASEPFLISYSNQSLKIFIDYLNDNCFKCKFNVNCQEIPLNHIWNGRNHLLYCCFNLEKVFSKELIVLNCKISVCESNSNSSYLVQMDVFKNLLKVIIHRLHTNIIYE